MKSSKVIKEYYVIISYWYTSFFFLSKLHALIRLLFPFTPQAQLKHILKFIL